MEYQFKNVFPFRINKIGNPYHDEQGRFSSGDGANSGVVLENERNTLTLIPRGRKIEVYGTRHNISLHSPQATRFMMDLMNRGYVMKEAQNEFKSQV